MNTAPLLDRHIQDADMVFISAMIIQRDSVREVATRCKAMGKTVVAGGPLFNAQFKDFPEVDHFVLNEAEVTLPLFLEDLAQARLKRVYASETRPDISLTPVPDWSLVNMKAYVTMSVQYSRGCPFNCEFCGIVAMNGRNPRTKSPGQLLAELDSLYEAGWRGGVFIVDDNFIGNSKEVKRMLPRLVAWQQDHGHPFQFMTEASINLADDGELMGLMSEANFHKVFLGIETPSVEGLRECGKFQNAGRDMAHAVRAIQRQGLQVMAGFIVGFDSDTESIFDNQIKFIQKTGIVTAMVGLLNALPQTRLWDRLQSEHRLLETTKGANTDGELNFIPKMPSQTLLSGYRSIITDIYSRKKYYRRIHTFLNNYTPTVKAHMTLCDAKAFLKSMFRIGIFSLSSPMYWRLLARTLLTNSKALPAVVELIICGEHYRKMRNSLLAGH
jgi:radical SAM superfamily enzyme YgiQ (UPF0313 family)